MSTESRTAHQGADEGFHEIQLSGKQLVFLFMATTVVSIVIFLCGVLVGRGARVDGAAMAEAGVASAAGGTEAPAQEGSASAPAQGPVGAPTQVENSDLTYLQMLTAQQQANEVPQPPAEEPASTEPTDGAQAAAAAPPDERAAGGEPTAAEPAAAAPAAPSRTAPAPPAAARGDITIQVAALKQRGEAERIARRLRSKGFDAYVADPVPGSSMYRVRVGHFTDKAEAERVRARLAREERFKPWITR